MGKVLSIIADGLPAILADITKLVTDVTATVGQLQGIAGGFAQDALVQRSLALGGSVAVRRSLARTNTAIIFLDSGDAEENFQTALKAAMTAAENASEQLFKTQYPVLSTAGSDSGVVKGYNQGGDLSSVVTVMTQDFDNWNLPQMGDPAKQMAKTIDVGMQAGLGMTGSSFGRTYLNPNQSIAWTVAYGEFAIDKTSNGLVYAFSAGLDSGF